MASTARKEKLKQMIEQMDDMKAESLSDHIINNMGGPQGEYSKYGDFNPFEMDKTKTLRLDAKSHDKDTYEKRHTAQEWAQKLVDKYLEAGEKVPEVMEFGGKIYKISYTTTGGGGKNQIPAKGQAPGKTPPSKTPPSKGQAPSKTPPAKSGGTLVHRASVTPVKF